MEDLSSAKFIALTTDGWTSRATQSFMTITAHDITDNWVNKNPVLQTRAIYESHTSDHLVGNTTGSCSRVENLVYLFNLLLRDKCLFLTNLELSHFSLLC